MRTISAFAPDDHSADNQDIRVTSTGDLEIVDGLENVRQRVIERLRFWVGQWFLRVEDGVPYRPEIFHRPTSVGLAAAVVTSQIRDVEEVTGVANVVAQIDPLSRRMTYSATIMTVYGDMQIGETIASTNGS